MTAQAHRGEPDEVEKTLDRLSRTTSGLSIYAMTPLLDAYRRAGDLEGALRLFERIYATALETAGSKRDRVYAYDRLGDNRRSPRREKRPSVQRRQDASSRNALCPPISIMIDLLSTAGRHEDIANIWARAKKDGFGFDSDNWNHLAASMARAGQLEEALSVVEHVLYHDSPNTWMRSRVGGDARNDGEAKAAVEATAGKLVSRHNKEAGKGEDKARTVDEFDPLPDDTQLDPAVAHRPDAASQPSTPPNRRHEARTEDDPYVELPFERPELEMPVEEEYADGEGPPATHKEVDTEEITVPDAFYLDSIAGRPLTRDLDSFKGRYSPWYAHFDTMEAISRGLADLREAYKVIALLDKHRSAARLLDLHERKVEMIRERQKEAAVRSARDLIDGVA